MALRRQCYQSGFPSGNRWLRLNTIMGRGCIYRGTWGSVQQTYPSRLEGTRVESEAGGADRRWKHSSRQCGSQPPFGVAFSCVCFGPRLSLPLPVTTGKFAFCLLTLIWSTELSLLHSHSQCYCGYFLGRSLSFQWIGEGWEVNVLNLNSWTGNSCLFPYVFLKYS